MGLGFLGGIGLGSVGFRGWVGLSRFTRFVDWLILVLDLANLLSWSVLGVGGVLGKSPMFF